MTKVGKTELRKFGFSVGGVFLLLGAVSWYRDHEIAPRVLWALGILLVVPGLVAPGLLGPVQRGWMAFATVLGHVNTRILLGVFYYVVMTPIGFMMRLVRDPLNRSMRDGSETHWVRRESQPVDPTRYQRQF
jgi:hypothetical protein